MKAKWIKSILVVLSMICIFSVSVIPTYATQQGTNGDELQIMEAEQLEIQLGVDWAGVEFQLKTDAGLYPGTVVVGTDGVLRMEIGGSSKYILTCMNSSIAVPEPNESVDNTESTQAPATNESATDSTVEETTPGAETEQKNTVADIPVAHLAIFVGGMILAIGTLIVMHVMKKKREMETQCDDDDE